MRFPNIVSSLKKLYSRISISVLRQQSVWVQRGTGTEWRYSHWNKRLRITEAGTRLSSCTFKTRRAFRLSKSLGMVQKVNHLEWGSSSYFAVAWILVQGKTGLFLCGGLVRNRLRIIVQTELDTEVSYRH